MCKLIFCKIFTSLNQFKLNLYFQDYINNSRDDFNMNAAKRIVGLMCQESKRADTKLLSKSMNHDDSIDNDDNNDNGLFKVILFLFFKYY